MNITSLSDVYRELEMRARKEADETALRVVSEHTGTIDAAEREELALALYNKVGDTLRAELLADGQVTKAEATIHANLAAAVTAWAFLERLAILAPGSTGKAS